MQPLNASDARGPPDEEEASAGSTETDDDVTWELAVGGYVREPLRLANRPPMTTSQKIWSGLFYGQLVLQLVAVVWIFAAHNTAAADGFGEDGSPRCPGGYLPFSSQCIAADVVNGPREHVQRFVEVETHVGDRRLSQATASKWEMLGRCGGLFSVLIPLLVAFMAGWLLLLTQAAVPVTWGMLACNLALMGYGFYLTQNWMLLVVAAVLATLAAFGRNEINAAANAMQVAADALKSIPSVFGVCALVQLAWVIYGFGLLFAGNAAMGSVTIVCAQYSQDADCEDVVEPSAAARFFMSVTPFLFLVMTFFFKNLILAAVSLGIGCWYFPEEAQEGGIPPANASLRGLQLSVTTSSGSVFAASLILGFVTYARQRSTHCCWFVDPMACLMRALWCMLEGVIGALTRFTLIGHLFHGDGLCFVASATLEVLKRQLPGFVITGFVAEKVLNQAYMTLAVSVGYIVWWYIDWTEDLGIFKALSDGDAKLIQWELVGLTLLMLYGVRHPLFTAFVIVMLDLNLGEWINSFQAALLCASTVAVVFQYVGKVIEYATDTVFYCLALEAEGGRRQLRLRPLYDAAKKHGLAGEAAVQKAQGQQL